MNFSLSISAILVAAIVLALAVGRTKVLGGALTIGGMVAYHTYVTRIFEPISPAMELYARVQSIGASIRRVREVLALEPTVRDDGHRQLTAGSWNGALSFAMYRSLSTSSCTP